MRNTFLTFPLSMFRRTLCLPVLFTLLAACGKPVAQQAIENAIEQQTGGQASVSMNGDAMQVTTSEGTFTAGQTTMPSDWPTDVPAYVGATVQYSASVNPTTGQPGSMVMLMSSDGVAEVAAFYKTQLVLNGWALSGTLESAGTTIMGATKGDRVVSLSIAGTDGQTSITIGVGKQ